MVKGQGQMVKGQGHWEQKWNNAVLNRHDIDQHRVIGAVVCKLHLMPFVHVKIHDSLQIGQLKAVVFGDGTA